ncbi:MAG: hypothetical protein NXY57DRAFT_1022378 [Lentinula lateritia]|uniref:Uncharacterized protein n=1 Tax=Lentinula lateritia TaxID=40482 RepID=A0ABQ8V7B8_9AGAR|nr:MAG: hypothetical protein NXY57DRAFT_1022378 [Lentinula lateritia]KAJ4477564.1 hypothetical protein C8R41DRAFT_869508 [Lentinula lateritia]
MHIPHNRMINLSLAYILIAIIFVSAVPISSPQSILTSHHQRHNNFIQSRVDDSHHPETPAVASSSSSGGTVESIPGLTGTTSTTSPMDSTTLFIVQYPNDAPPPEVRNPNFQPSINKGTQGLVLGAAQKLKVDMKFEGDVKNTFKFHGFASKPSPGGYGFKVHLLKKAGGGSGSRDEWVECSGTLKTRLNPESKLVYYGEVVDLTGKPIFSLDSGAAVSLGMTVTMKKPEIVVKFEKEIRSPDVPISYQKNANRGSLSLVKEAIKVLGLGIEALDSNTQFSGYVSKKRSKEDRFKFELFDKRGNDGQGVWIPCTGILRMVVNETKELIFYGKVIDLKGEPIVTLNNKGKVVPKKRPGPSNDDKPGVRDEEKNEEQKRKGAGKQVKWADPESVDIPDNQGSRSS